MRNFGLDEPVRSIRLFARSSIIISRLWLPGLFSAEIKQLSKLLIKIRIFLDQNVARKIVMKVKKRRTIPDIIRPTFRL